MIAGPLMPSGDEDEYLGWSHTAKSLDVWQSAPTAKVSYPSKTGGKPFRVIIRQKPNPIGFHVRLPGDKT